MVMLVYFSILVGFVRFLVDFFDMIIIRIWGMLGLEVELKRLFLISFRLVVILVKLLVYFILLIVFLIFFWLKYVLKLSIICELLENIIKLMWDCSLLRVNMLDIVLMNFKFVWKFFWFLEFVFLEVLIRNVKFILFL